jgi:hypothetical protein
MKIIGKIKPNSYIRIKDMLGNTFNGIYYQNVYTEKVPRVWSNIHRTFMPNDALITIRKQNSIISIISFLKIFFQEVKNLLTNK